MNVSELRQLLNTLPGEYDNFDVQFVVSTSPDIAQRQDIPIFSSFLDTTSRELLLAAHEDTLKLLRIC